MYSFRKLVDADVKEKKVLLRADFNVPLKNGSVADDYRIRKTLPTIRHILENKAKQLIIISHLGRPKGKPVDELRLDPVAERLSFLLGEGVVKLNDCVDLKIPEDAKIVLLENLRFYKEEKDNYEFFAKKLASFADIYVNDAFSCSHRKHASIVEITNYLPSYAGFLLEKEIAMLSKAAFSPGHPFVAIIGGAKIGDKIGFLNNLLQRVDKLLIGGAMAFTFLKAKGMEIGKSLYEEDKLMLAKLMLNNEKIVLPDDIVIADRIENNTAKEIVPAGSIKKGFYGLDIGPLSVNSFKKALSNAKTVFWNGPLGMFELESFAKATEDIAFYLAGLCKDNKAEVIVGGGDSASAVRKLGLEESFTHVSTGGGASIEFVEGKKLPGILALERNKELFS